MGFFDSLFGGGGASGLVDSVGKIMDEKVTSEEERLELENEKIKTVRDFNFKEAKLVADLNVAQIDLLKVDAASGNWFQSSWRPMIGWVGALAMLYNFLLHPLLAWAIILISDTPEKYSPPTARLEELYPIIVGMLGVAGMRSFDKRFKTDTK